MSKKTKLKKGTIHKNAGQTESLWLKHPYLIILLVAFIVFIRTSEFNLVNVDDDAIIVDKYDKISTLSSIPEAFTSQYGFKESTPYYRPVINLSFILDAQISGKNPGWYHVSNIIFHAIAVSLLFLILLKLEVKKSISLFISLLFLVHPLLTNAVVWIPGRNDLIAGIFCLLSFLYFVKFISDPSNKNIILHSLFYLLGILSKEVVLVLPAVCFVYIYLFEREKINKKLLFNLITLWIIPVIVSQLLKSMFVQSIGNVTYGLPAFIDNIRVVPEVISKILLPFNISVLPTFSDSRTIIGSILFIVIILLPFLIKNINRKRYYFGILWFLLFLLPGLLVVYANQNEGFDYLDTRDYLPMMGLIISAGNVLSIMKIKEYSLKKRLTGYTLLILLTTLTFIQSNKYENAEIFAKSAVESNPERPFFYQKLADYYYSRKEYIEAIKYLKETIKREPNSFFHYKNLALAYLSLKQYENAGKVLEKAYQLNNKDPDILKALIWINYESGRYKESLKYIEKVIQLGGKVDQGLYESVKEKAAGQKK